MQTNHTTQRAPLAWAICATSFGFTAVQLDVTIVNVALPSIARDLHTNIAGLQWVVDAYTLAFAVLLLAAGVLGDRYGSRRAYLAGFTLFTLASVSCALANDAVFLVAARVLQGVGAALLVPSSLALLSHACAHDDRLRARAVGLWTAAGGVSIAAGPVVGGLLLGSFGWRSIFWVNVPVCTVGILLSLYALPEISRSTQPRALDPLGQLLAVLTMTGLTGAVIEGGHLGWSHPLVLAGFAIALLAGALFVIAEARNPAPMLPLAFFRLPNFSPAVIFGILVNLTYYGVIFVLSLYLQQVRGYSPLRAGLAFLPLTATFIASNVLSGWVSGHFGSRLPMIIGALTGMLGFAWLSRLDQASAFIVMLPAFILIPGGMGLGVPAMTSAILSSVKREWSGTASAVLNAARQMGGAMGVAAFGALVVGQPTQIVIGLKIAALCSSALLLAAAAVAWLGIGRVSRTSASGPAQLKLGQPGSPESGNGH